MAFGENAELGMREQHDKNRLANDDARGAVIGELWVVREAERLEEGHRLRQIGNGKVDQYLLAHSCVVV